MKRIIAMALMAACLITGCASFVGGLAGGALGGAGGAYLMNRHMQHEDGAKHRHHEEEDDY